MSRDLGGVSGKGRPVTGSLTGSLSGSGHSLSVSSCCLSSRQSPNLLLLPGSLAVCLPCPIREPLLVELSDPDLLLAVLGDHIVVVDRHLLPEVPQTPVRDLDSMSVEQRIEDMTTRDGSIEDAEKFSSDVAGHPGIPRRVEPPDSSSVSFSRCYCC